MQRLLIGAVVAITLGLPYQAAAKPGDQGICGGFTGAARSHCESYCVTKNCPLHPHPSCDELRASFAKHAGTSVLPCDAPIATPPPPTPVASGAPTPQPTSPPGSAACPSTLEFRPDPGELDEGWTGLGHDQPLVSGGTLSFAVGCNGPTQPCGVCSLSGPIPNADADAGSIDNQRCTGDTSLRCTSDADCGAVGPCAFFFSGPVPLSVGGVSTCLVNRIAGAVTGTIDVNTGSAAALVDLIAQVSFGSEVSSPCPRCVGDAVANDGNPEGSCDGGARVDLECDANGSSPVPSFGDTSLDCPPAALLTNLPLEWDLTTGTTTRTLTAASPDCTGFGPAAKCFCPAGAQATRPNACIDDTTTPADGSLCVPEPGNGEGSCPEGPFDASCNIERFRGCINDLDCPFPGDSCVLRARDCYLDNGVIGGSVSAVGLTDPFAADNTAHPTFAALFCIPQTPSAAVNAATGLPGLGRLLLPGTLAAPGSPSCEGGERPLTLTTAFGGDLDLGWTGIDHNQPIPEAATIPLPLTGCSANPNDDCTIAGGALVGTTFLSPLPLAAGGVSMCLVNTIREPVTGTYNCATGCSESDVKLRANVFLVLDIAAPCPLCSGDPDPSDGVKGGTCNSGTTPGAACDASGVSPFFGATSNDCLPTGSSVGELDIDLAPLTTGTASLTAGIDCLDPLAPPGSCHCSGQADPNPCLPDNVCPASGVCENGPIDGVCSNQIFRSCQLENGTTDCEDVFPGSGTCVAVPRPCFGDTIERSGQCGTEFSVLSSVFCVPPTRAGAVNVTAGLPGPAAIVLPVTTDGCACDGGPPANAPPDCGAASASSGVLSPANHKLNEVHIDGVSDPDGDPVAITIVGIRQDEPTNGRGDGNTCPDAEGVGTSVARLRAERIASKREGGDGRVYHVSFVADDGRGGQCGGEVTVCVPRSRGSKGRTCVDQGPLIDSAGACGTTGGGSTTVRFTLTATANLQGLQLQVAYPPQKGSFTGSGGAVNCTTTSAGFFVANDLDDGTLIMVLASATDLLFPVEITCTYDEAAGQTLVPSDVGVTVVEVTENGAPGDPNSLLVSVEIP